jgi:multidrug efflux pump subunit AcrB
VIELGTSSGCSVQLQDRASLGHDALIAARNQILGLAAQDPRLVGVRPSGLTAVATAHQRARRPHTAYSGSDCAICPAYLSSSGRGRPRSDSVAKPS